MDNFNQIDPFEHIRKMQLNKIRINNAKDWDVAKYDQFVVNAHQDDE